MTRESVVFLFCLLLAVTLLLLNKLSRKYIGDMKAQVSYVNYPTGKIPASPLPEELKLYVETTGYKLMWAKLLNDTKVQVDLSNVVRTNYALTADFKPDISRQLSAGYRLIEIIPDTLFLHFEKSLTKKIPVVADILISFKKQFDFKEPMLVNPDSVIVNGPENIVSPMKSWFTERLTFENLDKSLQNEVGLIKPSHPTVTVTPMKARYTIAVEEYTEKTLEVEIQKINLPQAKEVSIYPKKVKVVCRVGLSNYESVKPENFIITADFANVDFKKSKYIKLEMKTHPSHVKNLDYSPKSVEYILYK
ncbi:MAG: hypothetical protein SH857_12250 [Chitinophagales bacterium]|nr:hypothetical protein [Chitinophagales bacterium]